MLFSFLFSGGERRLYIHVQIVLSTPHHQLNLVFLRRWIQLKHNKWLELFRYISSPCHERFHLQKELHALSEPVDATVEVTLYSRT